MYDKELVLEILRQIANSINIVLKRFSIIRNPDDFVKSEEGLEKLSEEGRKEVVVFPISFVSEHIETLYELDIEYGEIARELGLDYRRVKLDHKSPLLIDAIVSEIEKLRQ